MPIAYYQIRPEGSTDENEWVQVTATALPQTVGGLTAGSYEVRALGATAWSDPVEVTPAEALPLVDWRMPASVTVSSGISSAATNLNTAQATAAAKLRPSFVVGSSATEWVEYLVSEAGTVLLSWVGQSQIPTAGIASVSHNGVDQSFAPTFPTGGTVAGGLGGTGGRRQFIKLVVGAGDTIRLTMQGNGTSRTILPLLHKYPTTGPTDTYVVFGASREIAMGCKLLEDTIIADDATRDPIIFNFGFSGYSVAQLTPIIEEGAPLYDGVASHCYIGNILGNTITAQRPWDSSENAAINTEIADIMAAVLPLYTVLWSNTSFREYNSPDIRADDQDGGSLEYNDNIVHPAILSYLPSMYNTTLQRSRSDSYGAVLRGRGFLLDGIHGAYDQEMAELVRTVFAYSMARSWSGIDSFAEVLVSTAEDDNDDENNALVSYTEATYMMLALASTATKTSMESRLTPLYKPTLFFEAKRLITLAETLVTQDAIDDAQAALDFADSEGFVDMASPNTIAVQQARIDAIVIASYNWTVRLALGGTTPVTGWNRTAATAIGVAIADLNDDTGSPTGAGFEILNVFSSPVSNTGMVSGVSEIPSAVLSHTATRAGDMNTKFTGLDPTKTYDLLLLPCRSGTPDARRVTYNVNGVDQSPIIDPVNNVSTFVTMTAVAPNGSNEIIVNAERTAGGFGYHTVLILSERV